MIHLSLKAQFIFINFKEMLIIKIANVKLPFQFFNNKIILEKKGDHETSFITNSFICININKYRWIFVNLLIKHIKMPTQKKIT